MAVDERARVCKALNPKTRSIRAAVTPRLLKIGAEWSARGGLRPHRHLDFHPSYGLPGRCREQFAHRPARDRVAQLRCQLHHRRQYETPLGEALVRNRQLGRVHDEAAEKQNIDINGTWAVGEHAPPAELPLDAGDPAQQLPWEQIRPRLRHQVQEPPLVAPSLRLGFVYRRNALDAQRWRMQPVDRRLQHLLALPYIRTQPQVNRFPWHLTPKKEPAARPSATAAPL